jgi:hypothetical protein
MKFLISSQCISLPNFRYNNASVVSFSQTTSFPPQSLPSQAAQTLGANVEVLLCREITLEVLGQEPVGAFMVRESTSKPGCYALSLRVPRDFQPTGIAHYLIMRTNKGFKIKVSLTPTAHRLLLASATWLFGSFPILIASNDCHCSL